MTPKLIKIILFMVISLTCLAAHAKQPAAILETDLFILSFPEDLKLRQVKSEKTQKGEFTYAYIESNKERKKSIFLIITGEENEIIEMRDMKSMLYLITNNLRKTAVTPSCKGEPTEIVETRIGDSMALYFEKNDKDCIDRIQQKYWSVIRKSSFITFYISKPRDGSDAVFNKLKTIIKQVKFK